MSRKKKVEPSEKEREQENSKLAEQLRKQIEEIARKQEQEAEEPIEQEEETGEENLEQEVEEYPSQFSNFSDWQGRRTALILESGELQIPETNIEQIAQTSPVSEESTDALQPNYITRSNNAPDYTGSGTYEQRVTTEISPETLNQLREIKPRMQQTSWGERENLEREARKYQETITPEPREERRELPFERKAKFREKTF